MAVSRTEFSEHDNGGWARVLVVQRAGGGGYAENSGAIIAAGAEGDRTSVAACLDAVTETASARASYRDWPNDEAALLSSLAGRLPCLPSAHSASSGHTKHSQRSPPRRRAPKQRSRPALSAPRSPSLLRTYALIVSHILTRLIHWLIPLFNASNAQVPLGSFLRQIT